MKTYISTVLLLISLVIPAQAWNSLGHRAVAEIVWRQMDAKQRQTASEILKQHPHYTSILTADVPAGVDRNEWAFLTAAVWPDLVRPSRPGMPFRPESVTKYNAYPHGIDLPFTLGSGNADLIKNFRTLLPLAENAVIDSLAALKNPKASGHDKAVGLCWVLHLGGDLHQPMHAATLVTRERPQGSGAGSEFIFLDLSGNRMNLHTFWDQLPGVDLSYKGTVSLANDLTRNPELKPSRLREYQENKTVGSWLQESHRSAATFGYAEAKFVHVDDIKSGKVAESDIPKVSREYVRKAKKVADRRLALAAQRVSDELKKVW